MPTVSRNIFWSFVTAFLQIYTGGIIFILMAKMMSLEDFGLVSFGFSFATLLATCIDFGQSLMIMKDYPQDKFDSKHYVLNSLSQKLVYVFIFGLIAYLYLILFYDGLWVAIGNRFMIFAVFSAFTIYLQAILRVRNRFKDSAISMIIYSLAISAVVLLYFLGIIDMLEFVNLMVVSKLIQLLFTSFLCKDLAIRGWFNKNIQTYLFKNAWSYGAHFIFGTFYFTIDTQIIALLLEAKDVALYQSIFRIIYIFLIVSDVASSVLLPYLSSKYANQENIDTLSNNILYLLLIVGGTLFLLFTLFYQEIITVLYTNEYLEAYPLVLPLSIVILLRTAASLLGSLLTISNNQANRVKVVFISMVFSVGLNFLMIPSEGVIAAAWVSVIVHFVLLGGYYFYSKRDFPTLVFLTKENLSIVFISLSILLLSRIEVPYYLTYRILLVVVWLSLVLFFLKRHNKMSIIVTILKDKGVA